MDNLWFLTEERQKPSVIEQIITTYCNDFSDKITHKGKLKIRPIIENGKFLFTYIIENIKIEHINNIYVKTVSGNSSFVDYLIFKQIEEPVEDGNNNLIMAIEETKTSDSESRNTSIYQRGTKFVYLMSYYKSIKMYMLYNEESDNNKNKAPSQTNIFGTNMFLTLGVSFIGKDTSKLFRPFKTIDDLIDYKNNMQSPPDSNIPIKITKSANQIKISGRLSKPANAGNLNYDPNVGALTTISKCLRVLGWSKDIIITQHKVKQSYIDNLKDGVSNKFLSIAQMINIKLDGIKIPQHLKLKRQYWHYEKSSEKITTILLHILCLYHGLYGVYENHAGCERGYFYDKNGHPITIPKKNKNGEEINIPDVVLYDSVTNYIILVEGKKLSTLEKGIEQIKLYDLFENEYIKPNYPNANILRCVSVFGGDKTGYIKDVLIYMNDSGEIYINPSAPTCIKDVFHAEGVNI